MSPSAPTLPGLHRSRAPTSKMPEAAFLRHPLRLSRLRLATLPRNTPPLAAWKALPPPTLPQPLTSNLLEPRHLLLRAMHRPQSPLMFNPLEPRSRLLRPMRRPPLPPKSSPLKHQLLSLRPKFRPRLPLFPVSSSDDGTEKRRCRQRNATTRRGEVTKLITISNSRIVHN